MSSATSSAGAADRSGAINPTAVNPTVDGATVDGATAVNPTADGAMSGARPGLLGTVLVIAKAPVPGRVKTRLAPPFSPQHAAELAAAAIADTLAAAGAVPAASHVLVLDGAPGDWVPSGWDVVAQVGGGLDARLTAAFAAASGPAVLVGMDTPQLRADHLTAFRPDRFDAGIGLAGDGGYWMIGFADPSNAARVIPGVPMSRQDTGAHQCERIRDAGLSLQFLDTLVDVDTAAEARTVACAAPHTAFARRWAELVQHLPGPVTIDRNPARA